MVAMALGMCERETRESGRFGNWEAIGAHVLLLAQEAMHLHATHKTEGSVLEQSAGYSQPICSGYSDPSLAFLRDVD